VLGAQRFFPHRQRALVEGFGFRVLALVVVEVRQVVEASGHVGVVRPQRLFRDLEGPFIKRRGLFVLALGVVEQRQVVEALCRSVLKS
jgi:hypothetical protein